MYDVSIPTFLNKVKWFELYYTLLRERIVVKNRNIYEITVDHFIYNETVAN